MKRLLILLLLPVLLLAQQPPPSVTLAWDTPPITPSLAGDWIASPDPVNLTVAGVTDWVHYYNTVNRKITGGSQLSNLTIVGNTSPEPVGRFWQWSDGIPVAANNTDNAIYFNGGSATFTVPADTVPRSLTVYVGFWHEVSNAKITAELSDGALVYTDDITLVDSTITDTRNYIITYRASKPNQTMKFTLTSMTGWVYLSAAVLVQGIPDFYNLYRTETAGTYSAAVATNIKSLTYTDATVVRGRTYYYIVRTANTGIESTNSNEVVVKVNNNVIVPPKPPGNLRVIIPPK